MKRGLALIIVIGILGVLAVLAVAFVAMAQLERRASEQRLNGARAYLLARSGIEDALARLELGQDPRYGGEDWLGDGEQGPGSFDHQQEVYRPGVLNVEDCPVRQALRPSFFAGDGFSVPRPRLLGVEGRQRGYSGALAGDYAARGNVYALKVSSSNAGIYINGGTLDEQDRDPDGPGAKPEDFQLNPNAAAEVAPLLANGVPDHRDASMEGPNGFLVRLLNNLDAVVSDGATSNLGVQIVESRPAGGYTSLDDLPARARAFKPYLTLHAWVDPKVVKPQPMDGRPRRWEDIDDAHRTGAPAREVSGVHADPSTATFTGWERGQKAGVVLTLAPGPSGGGTSQDPWRVDITATNYPEGTRRYPITWERGFVYAWSQLRPAPAAAEPRAPLSVNTAPGELLAAVFLGLKGAYLDVWDGSAGWEGGFSWHAAPGYPYPDQATEETPWIRTRVDYGMTYGTPERPWYGPGDYSPHAPPRDAGGKPLIQAAPLGRLKEIPPIAREQALAIASQAHAWISDLGPFRTWAQFNLFAGALPSWEDLDDDGVLDGTPYQVTHCGSNSVRNSVREFGLADAYTRRLYRREDLDSDARMRREVFASSGGSWRQGPPPWQDPGLGRPDLGPGQVPGLTFLQRDVLRAMANPNADLNDFNPDANLFKEVDKTDLCGAASAPFGYAHTTELSLDDTAGYAGVQAVGRITAGSGRLLAHRQVGVLLESGKIRRDTTQADFMEAYAAGQPLSALFQGPLTAYPLAGGQPLVSYPEPLTLAGGGRAADAAYDGQLSLGHIGSLQGPDETLRGDLFDTADATATGDPAVPDLRGPFRESLVSPAGSAAGNLFPDGVYAERDRSLKYAAQGNFAYAVWGPRGDIFYIACWVKPNWFPEASPRAHALVSLSRGHSGSGSLNAYVISRTLGPLDDLVSAPLGLWFVPGRNNAWQDATGTYNHSTASNGLLCPRRALIWGASHRFFASDCLNRRGIEQPLSRKPMGRLEDHRWQHVAMIAQHGSPTAAGYVSSRGSTKLLMGRSPASVDGGGWSAPFAWENKTGFPHRDGTANHLRFGEISAANNMNYTADATFACVRSGVGLLNTGFITVLDAFFTGPSSPIGLGRYLKEHGAAYVSAKLPAGLTPRRVTWTEVPCDLWFDENADNWLGDDTLGARVDLHPYLTHFENQANWIMKQWFMNGLRPDRELEAGAEAGVAAPEDYLRPRNDRFTLTPAGVSLPVPNGKRDVRIDIEVWCGMGTADPWDDIQLAHFDDPAGDNRIPNRLSLLGDLPLPLPDLPPGRFYYKAIFVNEWDAATRANHPLDVTPFLDDVTLYVTEGAGPKILSWDPSPGD